MRTTLLACAAGAALAACATTSPPPATRVAAADVAPSPRADVALTAPDQSRELDATRRHVTALRWDVQRRLEGARERGDRGEQRCLDEKLSELDASLRMLHEHHERFAAAWSGGDSPLRERWFRRAMTVRGRVEEVRAEARLCWSGGVVTEGTVTTVLVDDAS